MPALFVLLPADARNDALPVGAGVAVRRYPRADDPAHLVSLVRAGRDPVATRWRRGTVLALLAGTGLGGTTNGVLAGTAGMFGGIYEIAIPLGATIGAFLGGFTAAMTGTERPRVELLPLLQQATAGCVLVQCTATTHDALRPVRTAAEQLDYALCVVE